MWIQIYCTVLNCLPYCLVVYASATPVYNREQSSDEYHSALLYIAIFSEELDFLGESEVACSRIHRSLTWLAGRYDPPVRVLWILSYFPDEVNEQKNSPLFRKEIQANYFPAWGDPQLSRIYMSSYFSIKLPRV